jgi:murein DD-endopeptidase MepM/ murein hydrolase activator NlpD
MLRRPRTVHSRRALVVMLSSALFAATLSSASGGELEKRREQTRRQSDAVRRQLDIARASDTELADRLQVIEVDLSRRRTEAESARADTEAAGEAVARVAATIAELRTQLAERKVVFNRRAVAAYTGGAGRPLDDLAVAGELLSLPTDLSDVARRSQLIASIAGQDHDVLADLEATQVALAREEQVLRQQRDRMARRAADAERAAQAVAALKREQEAARATLQERIAALQTEVDVLAAEQARLEQLIRERLAAAARARAARGSSFLGRRTGDGRSAQGFIWPVDGYVTSGYGPRWGRTHTGMDVAAPGGTPIAAAKAGDVIYAAPMGGYGNLVAVDHGDSVVTLYAHQSRIAVAEGQEVGQGDVVGYVGTTGRSTGNHLHFEVRIDGSPRDPRPYLP